MSKHGVSGSAVIIALFIVLIVVVVANVYLLQKPSQETPTTVITYAKLNVAEITADCANCSSLSNTLTNIRTQDVNVTFSQVNLSSADAQQLVSRYSITKLPALIITGETGKTTALTKFFSQFTQKNGAVVIEAQPPYYSVQQQKVLGLVSVIRINDATCALCTSADSFVTSLRDADVVIASDREVDYNSTEGRSLVSLYGLHEVPSVIVSKDVLEYPGAAAALKQLNVTEINDSYGLTPLSLPYRNLTSNKVVGLVDVIYLSDATCSQCYDVSLHSTVLKSAYEVAIVNETFVDVNSTAGKSLINAYNISFVPTFVMSPDAKYYTGLMQIWQGVGTNETNGWFVFRNMTQIGETYKNIKTGEVIVVNATTA